jgi:predicted transcriptional regulator
MKEKKSRILDFLGSVGRASTTRIASAIKSNQWMAERYLEELEKESLVRRKNETRATYWEKT